MSTAKDKVSNKQFALGFSKQSTPDTEALNENSGAEYITVIKVGVLKLLKNVKLHKALSPDDISPTLPREVTNIICEPITTIYQMSLLYRQVG